MKSELRVWEGVKGGRYYLIDSLPKFQWFIAEASKQPVLAVDTETTGLDWVRAKACGIVVGWGVENNYYLPVDHRDPIHGGPSLERQLNLEDIRADLQKLLGNPKLVTYWWNAKYDLHILRNADIEVNGVIHDGVILSFLLDENVSHSLKSMSNTYISPKANEWEVSIKQWRNAESVRRRKEYNAMLKSRADELREDPEILAPIVKAATDLVDGMVFKTDSLRKRKRTTTITAYLKEIAAEELGDHFYSRNKLDHISYDFIPLDIMVPYACADVHYTWLLCKKFMMDVCSHKMLSGLYICEMQLNRILFETEDAGVKIDKAYLERIGPDVERKTAEYKESIFQQMGYVFNLESTAELTTALQKAGCKLKKLTKKSKELVEQGAPPENLQYSVDAAVLEELASKHEFAQAVLEYRSLKKIKGTYIDTILAKLDKNDYLHTQFNQIVKTGRMSSSGGVNLQNIPGKDKRIRKAFISPDRDHIFVFIDYSQIELRLLAHMSQDPLLLSCYPKEGEGLDVHSLTCAEALMNMEYEEFLVMKADDKMHDPSQDMCQCNACTADRYRKIAKIVNFGIPYGVGPGSLQTQVSTPQRPVSFERCKNYIDAWFGKYYNVERWIAAQHDWIYKKEYVQNMFGRYRRFPGVRKLPNNQRFRCYRQGANFMIQGSAADLFKVAINRVHKLLEGTGIRLVNVVHDEIQFYCPRDKTHLIKDIKEAMEDFEFDVPIIADLSYSDTDWGTKKELIL